MIMKDFIKMALATLVGLALFCIVGMFFFGAVIGAVATLSKGDTTIPTEGVLEIDMTAFSIGEQDKEADPLSILQSGEQVPATVGILKAVNAIKTAATDPGVRFIYMKPDMAMGGHVKLHSFHRRTKTACRRCGLGGVPPLPWGEAHHLWQREATGQRPQRHCPRQRVV